jgi:two-component system, NarL family, invasion response regulator UvrY
MIKILIADDHQLVRDAWSLLLGRNKRFKVIGSCSDSTETVKLSRKLKPDVLLLDINMKPFNGLEVTRQIQRQSPEIRIIAVTMNNQPAYAKKILQLGARGYVTKNSSAEEMTQAILEVSAGHIFVCEEMKELLADPFSSGGRSSAIHSLTEREIEIISLIKQGLTTKEIALELDIAIKTVEVHRHNVLAKLGVKNAASLIQFMNASALSS